MRSPLIVALVLSLVCVSASGAERPNIILIFSDDHGYADLSCQGIHTDLRTPHLDALAAGGARLTNGYVTAPQCVPSRAGLLSGRYQNRLGVESNGHSLAGFNAEQTLAERLKHAGYATGMTGKWHLGPQADIVQHGFDDVYYKHSSRAGWANFDLDGSDRTPGGETSQLYHLDANSAAACAFIKRHHDEPFFFYCAYRAPHVPLDAPPKYLDRFPDSMPQRRRQALAMIAAMDDGVGRILATLRTYGIEEKTLIFFIGDNGAPLKIHKLDAPGGGPGWDGSLNDPLNGEKGMLSEGGIRVPFVVSWKGRIPGGQILDRPAISLDVAATAVALAGLPADATLDGINLMPYLSGEGGQVAEPRTLYWRWVAQAAIREGRWKYLRGGDREYLFDLQNDREEKHSLLREQPEVAARLSGKLKRWSSQLEPPGLATRQMSAVWLRYFDHYLDGKLVSPPTQNQTRRGASGRTWIARGGSLEPLERAIRVTPPANAKGRPFLVCSRLSVPGPAICQVRLSSQRAGEIGIAWRLAGQSEFPPDQIVRAKLAEAGQSQKLAMRLPAAGTIIHLRVVLPPNAVTEIESVELSELDGKELKTWQFGSAAPDDGAESRPDR